MSSLLSQVTDDNKKEYVKLYVNYRWCRGIEQQFLSLQKGFNEIIVSGVNRFLHIITVFLNHF